MSTVVLENKLYDMIMAMSLPVQSLNSLIARLNEAVAKLTMASDAARYEEEVALLSDFKGDWGGDTPLCEYCDSLRNEVLNRDVEL